MLAPPNQGSEFVDKFHKIPGYRVFLGEAAKQIGTAPDSLPNQLGPVNFELGVIAGTRPDNPLAPFLLSGPNDGRVTVESAKVEGMKDFLALPKMHDIIMWDKEVLGCVLEFLNHGKFIPGSD